MVGLGRGADDVPRMRVGALDGQAPMLSSDGLEPELALLEEPEDRPDELTL